MQDLNNQELAFGIERMALLVEAGVQRKVGDRFWKLKSMGMTSKEH